MSTSVYWFNKGIIRVCFLTAPIWWTFLQGFSKHENVKRRPKMNLNSLPSSKDYQKIIFYLSTNKINGCPCKCSRAYLRTWSLKAKLLCILGLILIKYFKLQRAISFGFKCLILMNTPLVTCWGFEPLKRRESCKMQTKRRSIWNSQKFGFYYFMKAFKPPPAPSVSWL